MLVYSMMFLVPSVLAVLPLHDAGRKRISPWLVLGALYALVIGFRHEVGGDWYNYLDQYYRAAGYPFVEFLTTGDPGYAFLNWIMVRQDLDIYGVNLVCGVIFVSGLIVFCRQQPAPWLAFSVAVPYLMVVLAMGYTRQGVALGLLFSALAMLERGRFKLYLVFIAVAVLFHKSALLMIPLGLFLHGQGRVMRVIAIALAGYVLWDALLAQYQGALWRNYVEAEMVSEGALVRALMNLPPSLVLLIYWKRWKTLFPNSGFWFWVAVLSIISVGLVPYASTAVDRVALYFSPIQIVVLSRLPSLMRKKLQPQITVLGVLLGYGTALWVWLNYATHAQYWLPYQNAIFL